MRKLIKMTTESGFTLIELMIVVAIIGILSVVAIPTFDGYQKKAKKAEAKIALSNLYTGEKVFYSEYNTYVADLGAIGYGYGSKGPKYYISGFGVANTSVTIGGAGLNKEMLKISGAFGGPGNTNPYCSTGNTIDGRNNAASANFNAGAVGGIGSKSEACDVWHINQDKVLVNAAPTAAAT